VHSLLEECSLSRASAAPAQRRPQSTHPRIRTPGTPKCWGWSACTTDQAQGGRRQGSGVAHRRRGVLPGAACTRVSAPAAFLPCCSREHPLGVSAHSCDALYQPSLLCSSMTLLARVQGGTFLAQEGRPSGGMQGGVAPAHGRDALHELPLALLQVLLRQRHEAHRHPRPLSFPWNAGLRSSGSRYAEKLAAAAHTCVHGVPLDPRRHTGEVGVCPPALRRRYPLQPNTPHHRQGMHHRDESTASLVDAGSRDAEFWEVRVLNKKRRV